MLSKYLPIRSNLDDTERDLQAGEHREANNLVVYSDNVRGVRRANTIGTLLAGTFPGLAVNAKCIGASYHLTSRRAIYLYWQNVIASKFFANQDFDTNTDWLFAGAGTAWIWSAGHQEFKVTGAGAINETSKVIYQNVAVVLGDQVRVTVAPFSVAVTDALYTVTLVDAAGVPLATPQAIFINTPEKVLTFTVNFPAASCGIIVNVTGNGVGDASFYLRKAEFANGNQCVLFEVDSRASNTAPVITKLVSSYSIPVTERSHLNNGRFVNDLFYFNFPDTEMMMIDIAKAKAAPGFYDALPEVCFTVIKAVPAYAPTVVRNGATPADPAIIHKSFQFATILHFLSDERSDLSGASDFLPAIAEIGNAPEQITVSLLVQDTIFPVVKSVELFVRNTNDPADWRSVDTIDAVAFAFVSGKYKSDYIFKDAVAGALMPLDDAIKLFNNEPRRSNSTELINNRLFGIDSLVNYNDEPGWDIAIVPTVSSAEKDDRVPAGVTLYTQSTFQYDSEYIVGLVFKDRAGVRVPGSVKNKVLTTPAYPFIDSPLDGFDVNPNVPLPKIGATLTISGKPPSYAHTVVVARSKNRKWDWQIMQKCLLRIPYSPAPWTQPAPFPTGTFLEDGYLYYDFKDPDVVFDKPRSEYVDIVIPADFPFTIDDTVIVDFAIKLYDGTTATENAIILSNKNVVKIFSNKIRVRGDHKVSWQTMFWNFYKFVTGLFSSLSPPLQDIDNNNCYFPIIFKKRAASIEENVVYDVSEFDIINPGGATRAFGLDITTQEDTYDTNKGAGTTDVSLTVGERLIQPFELTPDTLHYNHRLVVDWNNSSADSILYVVQAILYRLDQVTKLPVTEVAVSAPFSGLSGGAPAEYNIDPSSFSVEPGWYGYGVKLVSTLNPDFQNYSFDNGLTAWEATGAPGWNASNNGVDFFALRVLATNETSPPVIQQLPGVPYQGVILEVDIESVGVSGFAAGGAYTRQPNTDVSSEHTDILVGDRFLTPMLLDSFTALSLEEIVIGLTGTGTDGAGFYGKGQIWQVNQTTKEPIGLLYETPILELGLADKTFTFSLPSPNLSTPQWYCVGVEITSAPPTISDFVNWDFSDDFSDDSNSWFTEGGPFEDVWGWDSGDGGKAIVFFAYSEEGSVSQKLKQHFPSTLSKKIEVRVKSEGGCLFHVFVPGGISPIVSIAVDPGGEWAVQTIDIPLAYQSLALQFQAQGNPFASSFHLDYIKNIPDFCRLKTGAPVAPENRFFKFRTGAWVQSLTEGMPTILNGESLTLAPPNNLTVASAGTTGATVDIAPNVRTTIQITPTSTPALNKYGITVKNHVDNLPATVRIHSIRNIKVVSDPLLIAAYNIGAIPEQNAFELIGGVWTQINKVTGLTVKVSDVIYADVDVTLKGDCYHLAIKYWESAIINPVTPTDTYDQGFPFPSLGSDPDLRGVQYREKIGQSIGHANPVVEGNTEKRLNNVVRWSDPVIIESRLNNLNVFRAGNNFTVDFTRGDIIKLLSMNDNTLVCVHESGFTSLYINKRIVTQTSGEEILTATDAVIGDDRELFSGLGTINPESCVIVEKGTIAYGFDLLRGSAWRKSNNGVENITILGKHVKWFDARSKERLAGIAAGVDVKIYGGYNQKLRMYFLTFAPVTIGAINYPQVTIGWSELAQGWFFFDHNADTYLFQSNLLYSVKGKDLYLHDHGGFMNNFYGVQYKSSIKIVIRSEDDMIKLFNSIALDSNKPWRCTSIRTSKGNLSALEYENFKKKVDRFYADFLRDMNTPADMLKAGETPLLNGFFLYGNWIEIVFENDTTTERVTFDGVYLGFDGAPGHLLQK